jgi:hypothetical protein
LIVGKTGTDSNFGKEQKLADQTQNPGRKWRTVENDGDGNRYFDNFRFTPYTTDLEFYRDPNIYETEVHRSSQDDTEPATDTVRAPRGTHRTDEQILAEIRDLLSHFGQIDASNIHVEVQDGIVFLTGQVSSPDELRAAEGLSRNVLGVLEINNQLKMNSPR